MRRLDEVPVPDLWPTIEERAADTYVTVHARAVAARRGRVVVSVAALVITALTAFAAGLLVNRVGRDTSVAGPDTAWSITDSITMPEIAPDRTTLLAVDDDVAWVGQVGGNRVERVVNEGSRARTAQSWDVGAIADLAALGPTCWALTASGDLVELTADGSTRTVTSLGNGISSTARLAAAGTLLWVSSDDAALVGVDPENGRTERIALDFVPSDLVGDGDTVLWAVLPDGSAVSRIDTSSGAISPPVRVGPIGSMAADRRGLWVEDESRHELRQVTRDLSVRDVVPLPTGVDSLATTDGLVWAHDDNAVQAFTGDGDLAATVAGPLRSGQLGGGDDSLWVAGGDLHSLVLVARRGSNG